MPTSESPEWFIKSKTFLGLVVSMLPMIGQLAGFTFTADDASFVSENVDSAIQAIGGAIAMYGRFVAKSPIHVVPKAST